jgi:hypothetical protein
MSDRMSQFRGWLRAHLTYANVVATLALFIAIGGSSYAALRIGSRQLVNNSVRSQDLRNNDVRSKDVRNSTLTGRDVKADALGGSDIAEGRLGTVPNALRLDGQFSSAFKLRCPSSTVSRAGSCIEPTARPPEPFTSAYVACGNEGRELPDFAVLRLFHETGGALTQAEWTSNVYEDGPPANTGDPNRVKVVLAGGPDGWDFEEAFTPDARPFRCVARPSN